MLEQPKVALEPKNVEVVKVPTNEKEVKLARVKYTKNVPQLRFKWQYYEKTNDASALDEIRAFRATYFEYAEALNDMEFATTYWNDKIEKYGIKI